MVAEDNPHRVSDDIAERIAGMLMALADVAEGITKAAAASAAGQIGRRKRRYAQSGKTP